MKYFSSVLLAAIALTFPVALQSSTLDDRVTELALAGTPQAPILTHVRHYNKSICFDLPYATSENLFGKKLYEQAECVVLDKVAVALANVQQELSPYNLGIKVWDAYRPQSIEAEMVNLLETDHYDKQIKFIGLHCRGTSVDVTLVSDQGMEILMPTGYDHFGEKSKRQYTDISEDAIFHRMLLEVVMRKHGFVPSEIVWWHFDYEGAALEEPLDLAFRDFS